MLEDLSTPYFRNKWGKPIVEKGRSLRRKFNEYAYKAGYQNIKFPSLRISYAVRKLREGADISGLSMSMEVSMKWLNNVANYFDIPTALNPNF